MRRFRLVICVSSLLAITLGLFSDSLWFSHPLSAFAQPPRPTLTAKPEKKKEKKHATATPTATATLIPPTATPEPPTATLAPPTVAPKLPTATLVPTVVKQIVRPRQMPRTGEQGIAGLWVGLAILMVIGGIGVRVSARRNLWRKQNK